MSWFKLKRPMDEASSVDYGDIVNAKRALSQLGYYQPPFGNEMGAWVDGALFDGIRNFQRDNRLKVDGVMRPGGPTETAIQAHLAGKQWAIENANRWKGNGNAISRERQPSLLSDQGSKPFVTSVAVVDAAVAVHAAVVVLNVALGYGRDDGG